MIDQHCLLSLLGRKINKLLLVSEVEPYRAPNNGIKRRFVCRCDCGRETIKTLDYILSGHTKSCGCQRRGRPKRDLVGEKIGAYLIIKEHLRNTSNKSPQNNHHSRLFLCQCDSGGEHLLTMARLRALKNQKTCLMCSQLKD